MENKDINPSRVPPQNIEAEQGILGGILRDSKYLPFIMKELDPEDFYREAHLVIYKSIIELKNIKLEIDIITLTDQLEKNQDLEKSGGSEYLFSLMENAPPSAAWEYHCNIIKEKSQRRKIINLGISCSEQAFSPIYQVDEILSDTKNAIMDIDSYRSIDEIDNEKFYMSLYDDVCTTKTPEMKTGIENVDSRYYLEKGCTTVIAAESGTGKSAFCQQVGDFVSKNYGDVLFFSMESTKQKLGVRQIARYSEIPLTMLNKKIIKDNQHPQLQHAIDSLTQSRMHFIDNMKYSVIERAASYCETYALNNKLALAIFDYIQLFESLNKTQNRHLEISGIARKFNVLAKNLGIPIIVVSQLKESDPPNKRPTLNRLKESGDIRFHADNIIFLWSPNPEQTIYDVECFMAKGKDQDKFSTWLEFNGNYQTFYKGEKPLELVRKKNSKWKDGQ